MRRRGLSVGRFGRWRVFRLLKALRDIRRVKHPTRIDSSCFGIQNNRITESLSTSVLPFRV